MAAAGASCGATTASVAAELSEVVSDGDANNLGSILHDDDDGDNIDALKKCAPSRSDNHGGGQSLLHSARPAPSCTPTTSSTKQSRTHLHDMDGGEDTRPGPPPARRINGKERPVQCTTSRSSKSGSSINLRKGCAKGAVVRGAVRPTAATVVVASVVSTSSLCRQVGAAGVTGAASGTPAATAAAGAGATLMAEGHAQVHRIFSSYVFLVMMLPSAKTGIGVKGGGSNGIGLCTGMQDAHDCRFRHDLILCGIQS